MELHNLKSGAPHVELCGYIIELWYSAILEFCPHIKTKQKISSHDFHFLPLFLAVLVIVRNRYNPRPYVSQARTYIDMHDFQTRGHMFERRGTHAHVLVMMFSQ